MAFDAGSLSAEALLAIPGDEPERLFSNDAEELKKRFRKLAMRWHSDRCADPRADEVFAHLGTLRASAEQKIAAGSWQPPGLLQLRTLDGKAYDLRYGLKAPFELGMQYIGATHVTYVVEKQYADLFDAGMRTLKGFRFANDRMKDEMQRNLPQVKAQLETRDAHVVVLEKKPELMRLRDLLERSGGKVDPRHVAWVMSHLYNMACYLRWAGLAHNDLSLDTVFVSPQHHGGAVLGGWWYAAGFKNKLRALPTRSAQLAPSDVLRSHNADARVDLESIRAIGRELLGDPLGSGLASDKEVPQQLASWLRAPTSADALDDYRAFRDHVLPGSFGPRRFVTWDIDTTDLYKPRSI